MIVTAVRTLVAWVPDWPVVAAGAAADEPAAVVHANRVIAVTPAARAEGVDAGLRRREAQGRCPDLAVLAHDPARDARAWEPVVASLDDVCPRIEVAVPGRLAFPTRGPARYFGGDAALAAVVVERTRALVGVADGPFAAHMAARVAAERPGGSPLVVPPLGSPAFLAPMPVDTLGVAGLPDELLDVLRRLGLRTLGAVAALPAGDIVGRFGPDGTAAHRLAAGRDERPPATTPSPPDLIVRAELDPPAERVETAAFIARGLADELTAGLDARGLACVRLVVVAETEHEERLERVWRGDGAGGAAALSAGAIADRVRWQLDGWLHGTGRPTAGITLLELVPDEVVPATGRQLGFWGGTAGADERAIRALARVAGLLGPEAVTVPEWRGGRGPAEAVVAVPAAAVDLGDGRPAAHAPTVPAPWPGRLPVPWPAAVPVSPQPAEVVDAAGVAIGVTGRGAMTAPPARLRVGTRTVDIAAWAGPWPVEERWWDPERTRRRARLQVLDAEGAASLLSLEAGRWWVEAVYD